MYVPGSTARSNRLYRWLTAALSAVVVLLSGTGFAFASTNYAPTGWDIGITSYLRGPDYVTVSFTAPASAVKVNWYLYSSDLNNGSTYYTEETRTVAPDSTGVTTCQLYDFQGGGNPTYVKATWTDANGVESALPNYFWILTLDVPVYIEGISQTALDSLQSALANLQDSVGVNTVTSSGNTLVSSLQSVGNYSSPGGGDLAFSVPISLPHTVNGVSFPGVSVTLFSADQLAKLTWLPIVRSIMVAVCWVTFVLLLIARFSPLFKV